MANEMKITGQDIESNHDVAAFSWTLIFAPVLLLLRRDSPFIQFHARQAALLFVVGAFIFALPKPFSNLNIFTLAVAVTGFLNANFGKLWKVPIVFELSEQGISPSRLALFLKNSAVNFFGVLHRVFTQGPGSLRPVSSARGVADAEIEKKIKALTAENEILLERTGFLESQLLLEKFLHGQSAPSLDPQLKKQIAVVRKMFVARNVNERNGNDFLHFSLEGREVFLGNFSENGFLLFCNFFASGVECNLSFGSFVGLEFSFAALPVETLKKISQAFFAAK